MGTSASGKGPRPTTPLLPNWIPSLPVNPPEENDQNENDQTGEENENLNDLQDDDSRVEDTNRYRVPRSDFNSYSRDRATRSNSIERALRGYVTRSGGGPSMLARRMAPSVSRIVQFYNVVNTFKDQGKVSALRNFNLENYSNRSIVEVLAALTDVIFNSENPFNDIQDDSITKLAYSNTINRIVETEGIDLDTLTNNNIEAMMAIFIEETIATKVICDIGVKLFEVQRDCEEILEIEESIYQIVSGLVRNQIMPEITATQRGTGQDIERNIQNIYRIAFDCIAQTTNE